MTRRIWQLVILLGAAAALLTSCNRSELPHALRAQGGVLALSERSPQLVAVHGEWGYYPGSLLYPLDFEQQNAGTAHAAALSPRGMEEGGGKYATYRLTIRTHGSGGYYGIIVPRMGSAQTLWVDGKKVGQTGQVASSPAEEIPSSNGITALFPSSSENTDLVLQVSDFHNGAIGEVAAPVLYGSARAVTDYEATVRGLEIAQLTLLVLFGLMFFFRGVSAKGTGRRIGPLLVVGICIAGVLRTLTVHGAPGLLGPSSLLGALPWSIGARVSVFTYLLPFVAYFLALLPQVGGSLGRFVVRSFLVLSVVVAVGSVFVPFSMQGLVVVAAGAILALGLAGLAILSWIGWGWWREPSGAVFPLIAVGTAVLVLAAVNDVLVYAGISTIGYLTPTATIVYAILVWLDDRSLGSVAAGADSLDPAIETEVLTEAVRGPLRSIVGLAESLLSGRMGELQDDQVMSLSLIAAGGLRLSNAVADLVDWNRLSRNALVLELSAVPVESLVERVGDYLKPLMLVSSVEIRNELPRELPPVDGDRRRVEQIIYNLLSQAFHHREHGVVVVSGQVSGDFVEVTVSATADPPDSHTAADDDEGDTAASLRRAEGFSHMSLEVAKRLVELHGGRFIDNRDFSEGRFEVTFMLPKAAPEAQVAQEISEELIQLDSIGSSEAYVDSAGSPSGPGFRILVADSDLVTLQTMRNYLVNEHYRVKTAVKGEDVLNQIEASPPDLLLLDASLPGIDGFEVCRRVRKTYPSTELPVLILVAKEQLSSLVEGMTAGASDFISKPVVPDEFLARIKTHINLAKMNTLYSRFVPVELLHFLGHENVIELKLGDQIQREMTILFVDIRAFTNLSEGMTPQENFKFINSYLARITPIIRENNGFIDKYIGDAILALYPGSPEDALRSAIRMVEYLQEYNGYRRNSGYRPINIGIGIHTGNLIVGIIGDSDRMQGTVISDAVNLASRVQDVTKLYGANIIISQDTFIRLENPTAYNFRFLGKVKVKGKNQTVSLFEVFDGEAPERIALKSRTKQDFEDAILLFSQRKFAEASEAFRGISTLNPNDRAAALFLNRAELFLKREKANWLLK